MVKNLEENKFEILYSDNLITVKKLIITSLCCGIKTREFKIFLLRK